MDKYTYYRIEKDDPNNLKTVFPSSVPLNSAPIRGNLPTNPRELTLFDAFAEITMIQQSQEYIEAEQLNEASIKATNGEEILRKGRVLVGLVAKLVNAIDNYLKTHKNEETLNNLQAIRAHNQRLESNLKNIGGIWVPYPHPYYQITPNSVNTHNLQNKLSDTTQRFLDSTRSPITRKIIKHLNNLMSFD